MGRQTPEYRREYYERNKERIAERSRAYYHANKDRYAAYGKAYRAAHPERKAAAAARMKAYRDANLEACREREREYNRTHSEALAAYRASRREERSRYNAAYRKANPDIARANERKRRARKYSAPGSHTAKQVREMFAAHGNACYYCGSTDKPLTVDHAVPLVRGGSDGIENLLPACVSCNSSKNRKTAIEYIELITRPCPSSLNS